MVKLHNLFLFIAMVCWRIPPWKWGRAWDEIQAEHMRTIHKGIWELKKRGQIYQDKEGRLWSKKK